MAGSRPSSATARALVAICTFVVGVGAWNVLHYPPDRGYDAADHIAYADGLVPGGRLLRGTNEWTSHKPTRLVRRVPIDLVCPRDYEQLVQTDELLSCPNGHAYRVEGGVPVLLQDDVEPTQAGYWGTSVEVVPAEERPDPSPGEVDPYVLSILLGTHGNLYRGLTALPRYPIPELQLPAGNGAVFVELGSNWGRWSIAAARSGYRVVGIDPSLGAIRAARRIARQLDVSAEYVVADARHVPLPTGSADVVFSYGVLQHLSPEDVEASLHEVSRLLRPNGLSVIQLPNAYGLRNLMQQARRRFAPAKAFDVRYWRPRELVGLFDDVIGSTSLSVDGFFCLNPQLSDLDLIPRRRRPVLRLSGWLTRATRVLPPLTNLADSLYVTSTRREG